MGLGLQTGQHLLGLERVRLVAPVERQQRGQRALRQRQGARHAGRAVEPCVRRRRGDEAVGGTLGAHPHLLRVRVRDRVRVRVTVTVRVRVRVRIRIRVRVRVRVRVTVTNRANPSPTPNTVAGVVL